MSEKDFDEDLGGPSTPEDSEPAASAPPAISSKTPAKVVSKTPAKAAYSGGSGGEDISLYFSSTVGPGEKKQKLLVNTGNDISAIKSTVGNMFGLNPEDFHMTHGGVTLDEAKPLKNYRMKDGDTILLIPASTAGC
jgi:hypothetical protein